MREGCRSARRTAQRHFRSPAPSEIAGSCSAVSTPPNQEKASGAGKRCYGGGSCKRETRAGTGIARRNERWRRTIAELRLCEVGFFLR